MEVADYKLQDYVGDYNVSIDFYPHPHAKESLLLWRNMQKGSVVYVPDIMIVVIMDTPIFRIIHCDILEFIIVPLVFKFNLLCVWAITCGGGNSDLSRAMILY